MGLFNFKKKNEDILAIADGEMIDVSKLSDITFAQKLMGETIAFKFDGEKVTIASPCDGTLSVMFPTGHAFGIVRNDGVEILIHIGIDTVSANGEGFKILKKQGEKVKALDSIVEVDLATLGKTYDMSTMLIITNANGKDIKFIDNTKVTKGQSLLKKDN